MSALRGARWPVKYEVLKDAYVGTLTNTKTGRTAKHYVCAACEKAFPAKEMAVDHIEPVVPLAGFDSWDEVIRRLYCEKDGLQALCKSCHGAKTAHERTQRQQHKKHL